MEAANRVARRLVIPPHRDGSQTQQLSRPVAQLRESQRRPAVRLSSPASGRFPYRRIAGPAGGYESTHLSAPFPDATGTTPARWLLTARLQRAKIISKTVGSALIILRNKPDLDKAPRCATISGSILRFRPRNIANNFTAGTINGQNRHNLAVNACMDRFVFWYLRSGIPYRDVDHQQSTTVSLNEA